MATVGTPIKSTENISLSVNTRKSSGLRQRKLLFFWTNIPRVLTMAIFWFGWIKKDNGATTRPIITMGLADYPLLMGMVRSGNGVIRERSRHISGAAAPQMCPGCSFAPPLLSILPHPGRRKARLRSANKRKSRISPPINRQSRQATTKDFCCAPPSRKCS